MAKLYSTNAAPKQQQWAQGDIVVDDNGNRLQLSGDEWRPMEAALTPEQQSLAQLDPLSAFGQAAIERARELGGGAMQLFGAEDILPGVKQRGSEQAAYARSRMRGIEEGNPTAAMLGGVAPDVAGGLGVAALTGGAGIPAMLAGEAVYGGLTGAIGSPDAPVQGGIIGAGLGLAGVGAAGLAGATIRRSGIAERVTGAIGRAEPQEAAPPMPRVLEGTNTAAEIEAMGAKLSPYQRLALEATSPEQFRQAEVMRWKSKLGGNDFPEEMASQRYAFTDLVKRELGAEGVPNLTPQMVAQGLKREGELIGNFRNANGPVSLGDDQMTRLAQTVEEAGSTSQGDLRRILGDLQGSMSKNAGEIAPQDLNSAIRRLDKLSAPGSDPARITEAKSMLKELTDAIEGKLNSAEREAYRQAMYRYKILKTLDKGAAVAPDGTVNAVSFGRNWDAKTAQTLRGSDTLGKAADTFAAIQMVREHPGSTMQRVFAKAPGRAGRVAAGAVGAAVGLPVAGMMIP